MIATGWTWDRVCEDLDLIRLAALTKHWKTLPPPALQLARIAAALGIEPQDAPDRPDGAAPDDLSDRIAEFGDVPVVAKPQILTPEEFLKKS